MTRLLLAAAVLAALGCSHMREAPEPLESLCARQPAAPACRYLEAP